MISATAHPGDPGSTRDETGHPAGTTSCRPVTPTGQNHYPNLRSNAGSATSRLAQGRGLARWRCLTSAPAADFPRFSPAGRLPKEPQWLPRALSEHVMAQLERLPQQRRIPATPAAGHHRPQPGTGREQPAAAPPTRPNPRTAPHRRHPPRSRASVPTIKRKPPFDNNPPLLTTIISRHADSPKTSLPTSPPRSGHRKKKRL